jgi:phosphatidylserine/phosphatidylglycerophosphate/cardiolipin synthase-like enzyme
LDPEDQIVDTLVYEAGELLTPGWRGAAVEPRLIGNEGGKGLILYRKLDEASGLPIPDTDSASDWAQDRDDPVQGRRARYPGWALGTLFFPLKIVENAQVTVGVTPDSGADILLKALEAAHERIEISMYSLRHPTVIQRLVDQASAGVTVTLLLEGDPVAMAKTDPRWYQEMWACQKLHDTGHGTCWFMINAPEERVFDRYSYLHAKYVLIDRSQVLITSQNLTARGMPDDDRSNGTYGSRGVILLTDSPAVVARVAQIFDLDLEPLHHADLLAWSPTRTDYGPPPIGFTPVVSVTDTTTYTVVFTEPWTGHGAFPIELFSAPEAALRQSDALFGLLAQVGAGDELYVEALDERAAWGDDPVTDPSLRMEAFIAVARRGATVRLLLNGGQFDTDFLDHAVNKAAIDYANSIAHQEGLDLVAALGDPTQYGIHNKMVLVWLAGSGGYVHLGSLNGSETASKTNRELAFQIESDDLYHYLKRVFIWDWYRSRPLYLPLVTRQMRTPEPPVPYPVISEVLYNPSGAADSSEWVELFNPTGQTLDLSGWLLGDVGPAGEYGSGLYAFPEGTVLPAGATLLIARQAQDVVTFVPDLEFLIDVWRDEAAVPNMVPAGSWDGFGFALGNTGDEMLLLDRSAQLVDGLVYGVGAYPGIIPHPGVEGSGHSLERRPAIYDSDDCSRDFFDRYPPDPGAVSPQVDP